MAVDQYVDVCLLLIFFVDMRHKERTGAVRGIGENNSTERRFFSPLHVKNIAVVAILFHKTPEDPIVLHGRDGTCRIHETATRFQHEKTARQQRPLSQGKLACARGRPHRKRTLRIEYVPLRGTRGIEEDCVIPIFCGPAESGCIVSGDGDPCTSHVGKLTIEDITQPPTSLGGQLVGLDADLWARTACEDKRFPAGCGTSVENNSCFWKMKHFRRLYGCAVHAIDPFRGVFDEFDLPLRTEMHPQRIVGVKQRSTQAFPTITVETLIKASKSAAPVMYFSIFTKTQRINIVIVPH